MSGTRVGKAVAFIILTASLANEAHSQQADMAHPPESMGSRPIDGLESLERLAPSSLFRIAATPVGYIQLMLSTGESINCTGLVISPTLVLTARHCLELEDQLTHVKEEIHPSSIILFLDYLSIGAALRVPLKVEPIERGKGELDYMLLGAANPISINARRIPIAGSDPGPLEDLYIFHHPFSQPLSMSRLYCQATETPIHGNYFDHICKTQQTSSGAPVLDSDFRLVGIHIAGGLSPTPGTSNRALLLSRILAVSPAVKMALSTYGQDKQLAPEGKRVESVMLGYRLPSGQIFTQDAAGWTLSVSSPGAISDVRLEPQRASDSAELLLWDARNDVLYLIPKGGGEVKRKLGGETVWSSMGVAVKK